MSEPSTTPQNDPSRTAPGDAPRERQRSRRTPIIAASAVAAVLVAGGVTWAVASSGAASADAAGDGTLTVGLRLEPDNLDIRTTSGIALDQVLADNVYEGLITRGPDNTYVPRLAESYEVSDDGLEYTFTLRDGITFHDGEDLTAEDVVWSYETVKDDDSVNGHDDFAGVTSIASPDDQTVVIELAKPDLGFLWALTGRAGLVLEEGADNDLATSANGTGPFTIAEDGWKQGDSITLTRNDAYYRDPAKLAGITFVYYADQSALDNALQAGDLDVGVADKDVAATFEDKDGWKVTQTSSSDVWTLAFNNAKAPLDDVRVRQAIRQAIDKDAVLAAGSVNGTAIGGPIPDSDPGYEDLTDVAPYDVAAAKQLLAEAGYADGLALTLTIPSLYGTEVSDLLVSQLRDVGITLTVNSVEFPVWLDSVYTQHDFDLSFVDHAESRDFGNYADPGYYWGYDNAEVQRLYQASRETTDLDESAKLLAEAARIVSEDAVADWLFNSVGEQVSRDTVTGYPTTDTNARLDLYGVDNSASTGAAE